MYVTVFFYFCVSYCLINIERNEKQKKNVTSVSDGSGCRIGCLYDKLSGLLLLI